MIYQSISTPYKCWNINKMLNNKINNISNSTFLTKMRLLLNCIVKDKIINKIRFMLFAKVNHAIRRI